ncbi:glycosyltransferase [Aquibacillus halophilus]|uniref:Glycosyltransferase n=1 Tax=Aquibacillus halophilus TaxID=930132 RepID=A0A6A8D9T4_9BACI|nr:glycosyltransferase [Aquibacillus halophilus]MRH41306.1 glycosyltransferase [Aquibacillus halophilus]
MRNIQLVSTFMKITENWLYDLFNSMDKPPVYSLQASNSDLFPYDKLTTITSRLPGMLGKIEKKIRYYRELNKIIKQSKEPIVLHSHFGDKGYIDSSMLKLSRGKFKHVISLYGYDASIYLDDPKWIAKYQDLANHIDKFLVLGKNMQEKMINIGIPQEKIEIFHLGVEVDKLTFNPLMPTSDKTIKFIIASSFNKKKGIPDAIKSYLEIFKNHQNVELNIIGDIQTQSPSNLALKQEILDLIRNSPAKDTINLLGYVPYKQLGDMMQQAHFLLHPSVTDESGNQEGTPITILNSMAMGTVVLSTFHSDIPEIIDHNKSGILVQEHDYKSLAEEVENCLNDFDFYQKLVENGRKKVEDEFNVKHQGKKLLDIYRSL